jgi:hypothetical protein
MILVLFKSKCIYNLVPNHFGIMKTRLSDQLKCVATIQILVPILMIIKVSVFGHT